MSIATSRDERAQAIAHLETLPVAELERDLVHWSLASHASAAQYLEFVERQAALKDLHAEEEAWIHLLTEEIVRRRRAARASS